MTQDKLISVGQAAELLGVHPDTLRRWDQDGTLPALRTPGGHKRYRLTVIQEFMARDEGPTRRLSLQVDRGLYEKMERISQSLGVSEEDFIREGLRDVVARHQRAPANIKGNSAVLDLVRGKGKA